MGVYTKTGDAGKTGLLTGERIEKNSLRVEAYGTVDEFTSALGMARAFCIKEEVREQIYKLQKLNMLLMADLASQQPVTYIQPEHLAALETAIDQIENRLPALTAFLIPGESKGSAALDCARTTARRAERRVWELVEAGETDASLAVLLNRLSDFCFVLLRLEDHKE